MLSSTVLLAHVILGFTAIVLGPVAMTSRKAPGFHPRIGELYHAAVLGVCLSAAALAVLHWSRSWAFLPVALGSYAFALVALFDEPGRHSLWPWIIPTLGGTPLIAWAARRVTRTEWRAGA
jgi:uncharacterized membrane protein